tara:strand:- start:182 stop:487 length:306 start_codon:yes stop_codon:yes gene_type:complete
MSISSLRHKYKKLNNSKQNVRSLMLELFRNSGNDYTTERMHGHMYRCGMNADEGRLYKLMLELESEGKLVFVGHLPIYTDNNHVYIGTDPIFGLINQGDSK